MKLAIFGATGRTGQHLVKGALEAGHQVTVYARNPSKLEIQHPKLDIVEGGITNSAAVNQAIQGADAVLSGIGPLPGGPPDLMASAAKEIVSAMKSQGAKRLIWATGAGVTAEGDQPTWINKLISSLLKLLAGKVLEDSLAGAEIVQNSGLDWVIARAPMLTDEPGSGRYRMGLVDETMNRKLSRENYAKAMLDLINNDHWLQKMPAISDE